MGRIKLLDPATANGIAAGEVVERPSSVVKELVENAMDAGATVITVEIAGGGIKLIRVSDDGCGMDEEDAIMAFTCHATSKLSQLEDLFALHTMGFRGEALASISAASKVTLKTRQPGAEMGTQVTIEAGEVVDLSPTSGPSGTRIEVRDLFYNLPARYKFLKKDQTEAQYIATLCQRFALIRPDISFRLINQNKEILHTPGNNDPMSALYSIYGKEIVEHCIPIDATVEGVQIRGFVGKPEIARGTRAEQILFVNERLVRSKTISAAIDEAYKTMLMKGRHAFIILSLAIPSQLVDVNVHPQKAEVRFWSDGSVFSLVYHAIHNALLSTTHILDGSEKIFSQNQKEPLAATRAEEPYTKTSPTQACLLKVGEGTRSAPLETEAKALLPTSYEVIRNSLVEDLEKLSAKPVTYESEKAPEKLQQSLEIIASSDSEVVGNKSETQEPLEVPTPHQQVASPYEFSIKDLNQARIIGVAFSTYILLELEKYLILLDQHAAHEKVLFEQLKKKSDHEQGGHMPSQPLLVPEMITLTAAEQLFLQNAQELLKDAGFHYDFLGKETVALREVPAVIKEGSPSYAFRCALENLQQELPKTKDDLLLLLATTACKAAVKGRDRLDLLEIKGLLADLQNLDNPYHCPHGRPILIRLSQKDLEKEFKRIL